MVLLWVILGHCLAFSQGLLLFHPELLTLPSIPPELVSTEMASALDNLRKAAVPISLGSSVAIGISEGIAGAVGGLASRRTADVIGDRKIDNVISKVTSTSAFFGTRGLLRGISVALGLPRAISIPLIAIVASVISEATKAAQRHSSTGKEEDLPLTERLDPAEIVGDVTKWLVYDALDDNHFVFHPTNAVEDFLTSALYGAVASVLAATFRDAVFVFEDKMPEESRLPRKMVKSYTQSALEGAALFGCYQMMVLVLERIAPESMSAKFIFNQLLEVLEKDIGPITPDD
eukprot:gene7088-7839_t